MATTQRGGEDPPPRRALRCPRRDHAAISVRTEWFYCRTCGEGGDGRYYFVRDARSTEVIGHYEFRERWGVEVYDGRPP